MRETTIEARLRDKVKAAGGWAIKLWPVVPGLPDRLVLLPGGYVFFVETKAPGRKPSPAQKLVHKRLAALGHAVRVLDSREAVDEFINQNVRT